MPIIGWNRHRKWRHSGTLGRCNMFKPPDNSTNPGLSLWGCSLLTDKIGQGTVGPSTPSQCCFNWMCHWQGRNHLYCSTYSKWNNCFKIIGVTRWLAATDDNLHTFLLREAENMLTVIACVWLSNSTPCSLIANTALKICCLNYTKTIPLTPFHFAVLCAP